MKSRWIAAAALLVAVVGLFAAQGQGEVPGKPVFMRMKLDHTQRLLEGLALNDFELIHKEAQQLSILSRDEDWNVFETAEYRQHSLDFRKAADAVAAAADKKNLDGAMLGYMTLTLQCVECHKHVRDVRMAAAPPLDLPFRTVKLAGLAPSF
jgi:hypothetical protein